jgi:type IV pilus biogenesis protein CpaD/CtpE
LELLILQMKRLADELELLERNLPCKSVKRHKIRRTVFEVTDDVRKKSSGSGLKLRVCVCVRKWRSGDGSGAIRVGFVVKKTTYCNHREVWFQRI